MHYDLTLDDKSTFFAHGKLLCEIISGSNVPLGSYSLEKIQLHGQTNEGKDRVISIYRLNFVGLEGDGDNDPLGVSLLEH